MNTKNSYIQYPNDLNIDPLVDITGTPILKSDNVKFYAELFPKIAQVAIGDSYVASRIGKYFPEINNNLGWLATKIIITALANIYAEQISENIITPIADIVSKNLVPWNFTYNIKSENKFYYSLWAAESKIISYDRNLANTILDSIITLDSLNLIDEISPEAGMAYIKIALSLFSNLYAIPIVNHIIAPIGNYISDELNFVKHSYLPSIEMENNTMSKSENVKFYSELFTKMFQVVIGDVFIAKQVGKHLPLINDNLGWLATKITTFALANIYSDKISEYILAPAADNISKCLNLFELNAKFEVKSENKFYYSLWGAESKIISNDKSLAKAILEPLVGEVSDEGKSIVKFTLSLFSNLYAAPIVNKIIAPIGNYVSEELSFTKDLLYKNYNDITDTTSSFFYNNLDIIGASTFEH